MRKGSLWSHRLWYAKKRNARRVRNYFFLFILLAIFTFFLYSVQTVLIPRLAAAVEFRISLNAADLIKRTVYQEFGDRLKAENILDIQKNDVGRIVSVRTDTVGLNELTAAISGRLEERLQLLEKKPVKVAFGILTGREGLSDLLPGIPVKIMPVGDVKSAILTESAKPFENQIKYTTVLQVTAGFEILLPLNTEYYELVSDIPIAEQLFMVGPEEQIEAMP